MVRNKFKLVDDIRETLSRRRRRCQTVFANSLQFRPDASVCVPNRRFATASPAAAARNCTRSCRGFPLSPLQAAAPFCNFLRSFAPPTRHAISSKILVPAPGINDDSTCLCTVDGVAVPQLPFANHACDCKWLLWNSYAIYCTQVGRVIIAPDPDPSSTCRHLRSIATWMNGPYGLWDVCP